MAITSGRVTKSEREYINAARHMEVLGLHHCCRAHFCKFCVVGTLLLVSTQMIQKGGTNDDLIRRRRGCGGCGLTKRSPP